jgi:signal transduction histidine kinase
MTGFWKVFCATALVVAIAVAVVGALAVEVLTEHAGDQLERGVMSETALLAVALRPALGTTTALDPDAGLQVEVDALAARAPGRRITVVGLDGRVLADSAEDPAVMDNHGERPEILAAGSAAGPRLRTSRTLQQEMLYFALPVRAGSDGAVLGFARLAVPAVDIRAQQAELRSAVLRGALIALLVGALLAAWLARSVQQPIHRISEFVGRIARGEQAAPLPARGHGDMDDLAHAVNHMAHELDERFDRIVRDQSEMRRLETVRRDFVVNVSHELKTPLTAMRGFLEAVLDDPGLDPALRLRFLTRAQDNTERMVAIVGDLLSLARIEAADSALRTEPLDLRSIAAECHAEATGTAAIREIQLQLDLPGEEVAVLGDRAALATAISNLLDNAVKYSPNGRRVRVYVGSDGGEAWVAVTDHGPGIPAEETERIFERFYRTDKNRSRALGGTGLGLSIVKNVVSAHGGRVVLDTALGEGSTFTIRLPLQPPRPVAPAAEARDADNAPAG